MTSDVVVDASVALKWVLPEEGSDAAAKLLDGRPLHAPGLMMIEATNALWSSLRRGLLSEDEAHDALDLLLAAPVVPAKQDVSLVPNAFRLARLLDHPVYDCVYLSLALALEVPVVTADQRFVAAASRHADVASLVHDLGTLQSLNSL